MNKILQTDNLQIETLLENVKKQGLDFLKNLDNLPTNTNKPLDGDRVLNDTGIGTDKVLDEFRERFEPIMVAATGPRYWGFVTGGATPASIAGDWLASVYDQNTQTINSDGDCSARIEFETIQLLLQLFDLPNDFLGGFVTGATMSNFSCLAVARQWLGKALGKDIAKEGITEKLTILTATPHSSAIKSLSMLGVGSLNIIKVKTLSGNREAIDCEDLENEIIKLAGKPFILISSGGTVNTVDFDDFESIAKLHKKYHFWWHIDAAFGGFAAISPKYKHLLNGWEMADSITIDCHKWLNVPYESAFFLVKNKHRLLQVETFQNSNAPYLGDPLENFNFLNFLPENSRRLRALPAWFSLLAYGRNGYKEIVERSINNAQLFGKYIEEDENFELLAPIRLNTVCFTLADETRQVQTFLDNVNKTGRVFMTPTIYNNRKGIRAAFVNWRTTETDIEIAFEVMKTMITKI